MAIRKFIGAGTIVKEKDFFNLNIFEQIEGFLNKEKVDNFLDENEVPFEIDNYPCLIKKGNNVFAFIVAKETEEFKNPGTHICELIKEFTEKYAWCNELFVNSEYIKGLRVITDLNLSNEQKENFSKDTGFGRKEYYCAEIRKYVIKSCAFENENEFVLSDNTRLPHAPYNVVRLLRRELMRTLSSAKGANLDTEIDNLHRLVLDKSLDINEFYKKYSDVYQEMLDFSFILENTEYYKSKLKNVRKSFESKIATEVQKSIEKSTKATVKMQKSMGESTRVTARLTAILAIFTGVLALTAIVDDYDFSFYSRVTILVMGFFILLIIAICMTTIGKWKKS